MPANLKRFDARNIMSAENRIYQKKIAALSKCHCATEIVIADW